MSIRTGWQGEIRAAAVFAANDTYYACTSTVKCEAGADAIRLVISAADASAGNVTVKAEVSNGAASPTYSQIGGDMGPVAVGDGESKILVLPVRFCGGDVVRISFKCSAGATSAKVAISALAYVRGESVDPENTVFERTAVADTTYQLTVDSAAKQIITGGASKQIVALPDATTLDIGNEFEIVNASTEVIIAQNYGTASSVFEMLAPGDMLTCTCTSIATSAGTWAVNLVEGAGRVPLKFDDFIQHTNTEIVNAGRMFYGTGSSALISGGTNGLNCGCLRMILGTDAGLAGYVNIWLAGYGVSIYHFNRGYPVIFRAAVNAEALSDGTDTYRCRIGHLNSASGAEPASGIFFDVDEDGDVIPTVKSGGTVNVLTSPGKIKLGSTNQFDDMLFVSNAGCSRIDFWMNKAYLGNITSGIPKTTDIPPAIQIDRVAGTTNRYIDIDFVKYGVKMPR